MLDSPPGDVAGGGLAAPHILTYSLGPLLHPVHDLVDLPAHGPVLAAYGPPGQDMLAA